MDFCLLKSNLEKWGYAVSCFDTAIQASEYALFLDGNYITNEQMNDKRFLKLLEK